MRFRKMSMVITVITMMVMLLSITTYAHPGGTNAAGGHRDSSTGEFHYHHGYSAHQHYDMDGDGSKDCPYNFIDNTKTSSSSSKSSDSNSKTSTKNTATTPTPQIQTRTETKEDNSSDMKLLYWGLPIIAALTSGLLVRNYYRKQLKRKRNNAGSSWICLTPVIQEYTDKIDHLEETLDSVNHDSQTLRKEKESLEEKIAELTHDNRILSHQNETLSAHLSSLLGIIYQKVPLIECYLDMSEFSQYDVTSIEIPNDIYFIKGLIPVKGIITEDRPYGDFTVYVAERGTVCHANPHCGSSFLKAQHLYDVCTSHRMPCSRCGHRLHLVSDSPKWYKEIKLLQRESFRAWRYR